MRNINVVKRSLPERLATPLAFSLSSTWHFFLAILWRMDAFSRNLPAKESPQWSNEEESAPRRSTSRPHPSQSSVGVTFDPAEVTFQKAQYRRGTGCAQNCHSNKINSQYDIAYHILMILQCPGPWWRQSQQGENLLWRDLPSGGQIHSCSCAVLWSEAHKRWEQKGAGD